MRDNVCDGTAYERKVQLAAASKSVNVHNSARCNRSEQCVIQVMPRGISRCERILTAHRSA